MSEVWKYHDECEVYMMDDKCWNCGSDDVETLYPKFTSMFVEVFEDGE